MARKSTRQKKDRKKDETHRDVRYGYYLVAFIDLVGQSERLRKIAAIQWDDQEAAKALLKQAAGPVRRVRREFERFFTLSARNRHRSEHLTTEQMREYNRMRRLTFIQAGFSDCFTVSIPLTEREFGRASSALAVWAALYGIAGMCVAAMAEGIPLRGGIDVGFGVDMFRDEVYGPPLLQAYELECKAAEYPRILVGDGLMKYLAYIKQSKDNDGKYSTMVNNIAEDCRQMLVYAPDDRKPMLHMLSSRNLAGAKLTEPALVAFGWALSELERHRSSDNTKLVGYYERLVTYFRTYGFTDGGTVKPEPNRG